MKNKKCMLVLVPILCLIMVILSYLTITHNYNDSLKFKKEYEALNGNISSSNNKYIELNISLNNPIKYSNYKEIIDVIKNGTGIIYLGFPECPWCRAAVPVLLEAAKNNNVDKIYYLNIKNDRDLYVINDGKLTYALDDDGNEIKGVKEYFDLLDALDNYLSDYVIEFDNKTYETGKKRIYAPSVIFVKNGYVTNIQVSTVENHLDAYEPLTKEQKKELYNIYEEEILNIYSETCSNNSGC